MVVQAATSSARTAETLAMPADKGRRLHHSQRLAPVEPACKPDQGKAGGVSSALRLDVALLVQGELFAQEEVFGHGTADGRRHSSQKRVVFPSSASSVHTNCRSDGASAVRSAYVGHPPETKKHSWLLSLLGESLSSAWPCSPYGRSTSSSFTTRWFDYCGPQGSVPVTCAWLRRLSSSVGRAGLGDSTRLRPKPRAHVGWAIARWISRSRRFFGHMRDRDS